MRRQSKLLLLKILSDKLKSTGHIVEIMYKQVNEHVDWAMWGKLERKVNV